METAENLKALAIRQKQLAHEIETECKSLEDSDIVKENSSLKTEIEKIRADFQKLSYEATVVKNENSNLKNALYEHIFNEKNTIVNNTKKNLTFIFAVKQRAK